MIKKFKIVIVDEVEVIKFTKENILETAIFLGFQFANDNDMFEFREEILVQGKILLKDKTAYFGNYIVKDSKGNFKVLDEIGYNQFKNQYQEEIKKEVSKIKDKDRVSSFNPFEIDLNSENIKKIDKISKIIFEDLGESKEKSKIFDANNNVENIKNLIEFGKNLKDNLKDILK